MHGIYIYIKIYVYFFLNGMHSNLDKNQKAPTLVHAYKCLETDRQTGYLLLLFLVEDKVLPLRDVLGRLQYQLYCFVQGRLQIIQAGLHHHVGNGQNYVGPEERWLGIHLVRIFTVLVEDLESSFNGIQRQSSTCDGQFQINMDQDIKSNLFLVSYIPKFIKR